MATTAYPLTAAWSASARYTASGETDVLISNKNPVRSVPVFWSITADDTAPTISIDDGHEVLGSGPHAITLADTERLWLASRAENGRAAIEV